MSIEKTWTTTSGFRAAVVKQEMGFRCGYVGVPKGHPLHGVDYNDTANADGEYIHVHGGLTFSAGDKDYPVESEGLWWFGYDCGHAGDGVDGGFLSSYMSGPVRSLSYCVGQCESLAQQLLIWPAVKFVEVEE